jgi:hypothetical protein
LALVLCAKKNLATLVIADVLFRSAESAVFVEELGTHSPRFIGTADF